jgi:aminopeptidase N
MYPKGGTMLHMIRQIVNDDETWRSILRGLNQTFRHQTVTGSQVQDYIGKAAGTDLSKVFEQYLTTIRIPVLEYAVDGATVRFRWANVVPGFDMPVKVRLAGDNHDWMRPTEQWQTVKYALPNAADFTVDVNFYVEGRNVGASSPPGG